MQSGSLMVLSSGMSLAGPCSTICGWERSPAWWPERCDSDNVLNIAQIAMGSLCLVGIVFQFHPYQAKETATMASVEEALMEMYLAGGSVRRVEDITEAFWGTRVSPSAVSELNKQLYERMDAWRNQPITGTLAYVAMDGIWLKRSWGGEVKNVAVLVAIGVDRDGYRQVLGVVEGAKEDAESWRQFLRHLKQRGLSGVQLVTSDKCLGLVEALGESYPEADWQRGTG